MKLLIITQKIDANDSTLGFFIRWVVELSKRVDHVYVVCLEERTRIEVSNVSVFSLGKEHRANKLRYGLLFFSYAWRLRKQYDTVFVHMNQEYILMGGLLWRLLKKKIHLWRNHASGSWLTRLAVFISHRVYYTSPYSFTARFKRSVIMPVGIDESFFVPNETKRISDTILCLGRLSPVKHPDIVIDSLLELIRAGNQCRLTLVGSTMPNDSVYAKRLGEQIGSIPNGVVTLIPGVAHEKTKQFYRSHEVFVNVTDAGSFDKTIVEAMASGCLVVCLHPFFKNYLPADIYRYIHCNELSVSSVATAIQNMLSLPLTEKERIRSACQKLAMSHGLTHLMDALVESMQSI
jgi:glycosyltransferase involved in cell wall biosynthesis